MKAFLAGWFLFVAGGCAQIIGADFEDARPRVLAGCDPARPFGAPRRLPLNDLLLDAWAPRSTADQLSLYFTSADDAFIARRKTTDDDFGNPVPLTSINSTAADMASSVTADELTFFFETDRAGDVKIFFAKRSGLGEDFSTPAPVEGVNAPTLGVLDIQPYVTPDGTALYFGSTRAANGDYDLYRAPREAGSDRFAAPVALASINSLTVDTWPVVSPDELTIYFASARNLIGSNGSYDVLMATRDSKQQDFGDVRPVPGVNSAEHDYPSWISSDACTLYMTRGAPPAMFVATREK